MTAAESFSDTNGVVFERQVARVETALEEQRNGYARTVCCWLMEKNPQSPIVWEHYFKSLWKQVVLRGFTSRCSESIQILLYGIWMNRGWRYFLPQILLLWPKNGLVLGLLFRRMEKAGQGSCLVHLLRYWHEVKPLCGYANYQLIITLMQLEEFSEALDHCKKWILLKPEDERILRLREQSAIALAMQVGEKLSPVKRP